MDPVEFGLLFVESPEIAILVAFVLLLLWGVKVDALGFVSRRKDKRRERIFDTYVKLKEMGVLTAAEHESLVAEIRTVGVGLPSPAPGDGGESEEEETGEVAEMPWALGWAERVSKVVLFAFVYVFTFGMLTVFLLAGPALILVSEGSLLLIALGLGISGFGCFLWMKVGGEVLERLASKFPCRFMFLSEWMTRLEKQTEQARRFGAVGILAGVNVGLVVGFLVCARWMVVEFDGTAWAWGGAVCFGAVGVAYGVEFGVRGLRFLGVFDGKKPKAEVAAS